MVASAAGIKTDNADVLRALDRLRGWSGKQFGRALWDIGDQLLKSTEERFATETDPSGRPWKITRRKQRHSGAKILTNKGRLRRSFRRRVSQAAGTVAVTSHLAHAFILHHGAKNLRGRIRRRRLPKDATADERRARRRQRAIDKNVTAARASKPVRLPDRPILGVTSADETALLDIIRRRALRLWR